MTKGQRTMTDYKLVPVEPTEEMLAEGVTAALEGISWTTAAWIYEAMLAAAPAVQGEPVAHTFYILHDATEGQKYIKKDVDDGCLAIFEREEDAQRAKRRHPGTEYKKVDYYAAPQVAEQRPAPDVAALADALGSALGSFDDWCEGQDPSDIADAMDAFPWVMQARAALAAYRKQGGE